MGGSGNNDMNGSEGGCVALALAALDRAEVGGRGGERGGERDVDRDEGVGAAVVVTFFAAS